MQQILWRVVLWSVVNFATSLWAFDGDHELNIPDFSRNNWVDIKSYQPNKLSEQEWSETLNGFRMVEGTLDMEFAYVLMEVRFRRTINEHLTVGYHSKREAFYALKPIQHLLDIQFRLIDPYYASILALPAYDKRTGDLGGALTMGQPPWNYFRISHVAQDVYYNEKNFAEDRYRTSPTEDRLEGAIQFSKNFSLRFQGLLDRSMEQFFPEKQLVFQHKGQEAAFVMAYQFSPHKTLGWVYRGFDFGKTRRSLASFDPNDNRRQTLQFLSNEVYLIQPLADKFTLISGTQYDRFRNLIRDFKDSHQAFNYTFQSWYAYTFLIHPWNPTLNWEYAFYIGDTLENKDYLTPLQKDEREQRLDHKFRLSWEWHTIDNQALFLFVSTWSWHTLKAQAWDGGSTAIQIRF